VWDQPIEKEGLSILLVDTEGIGSIQQDANYDAKIFGKWYTIGFLTRQYWPFFSVLSLFTTALGLLMKGP
jgi:hypothetical protein